MKINPCCSFIKIFRNLSFWTALYLTHMQATSRRDAILRGVSFSLFFKELFMTKWIIPLVSVFVLGACSSMGSDRMGSGSSSGMSSGSSSGKAGDSTGHTRSGAYEAPGTANLPGSRGTAGTPIDPAAPAGSGTGTSGSGSSSSSGMSGMSGSGMSSGSSSGTTSGTPTTSGTYKAPGTANLPGSRGTAGTPIDPSAPSGSGTGSSGTTTK